MKGDKNILQSFWQLRVLKSMCFAQLVNKGLKISIYDNIMITTDTCTDAQRDAQGGQTNQQL